MTTDRSIFEIAQAAEASFLPYGDESSNIKMIDSFGIYEAEYAATQKGVGLFEMPHLGLVKISGQDRSDFLSRMLTNDIKSLSQGQSCRAFLLGKTGRIEADLFVLQETDQTWLVTNIFQAKEVPTILDKYLFSEDVTLEDVSESWAHLGLFGPQAIQLLEQLNPHCNINQLEKQTHQTIELLGRACVVYRHDDTGSLGIHLLVPQDVSASIYEACAEAVGGLVPNVDQSTDDAGAGPKRDLVGRGIGWAAYNTARIEAGNPLFQIDFGVDCLPHESGLLKQAVSFTKGCYLGQEIVARMENLGHPKRTLVGLLIENDQLPISGCDVFDEKQEKVIGAITSSTISPLKGNVAIAFAMVKWGKHRPNTSLKVSAEDSMVAATVHKLTFV